MLRLLLVAALGAQTARADETVRLTRDAPADGEPGVQASMNSLGGAFMPAVGEDHANEAAKEAERVRLARAADQAEARARAEQAAAQAQYAARQRAAQTAALERAKAAAVAQAEAAAAEAGAVSEGAEAAAADTATVSEDASPATDAPELPAAFVEDATEAAELAEAYVAAAAGLSEEATEEEEADEAEAAVLREMNAQRLQEAVLQQRAQLEEKRDAETADRAERAVAAEERAAYEQARAAAAAAAAPPRERFETVTTDALHQHTDPIKQPPRSPLPPPTGPQSRFFTDGATIETPSNAERLKEVLKRGQEDSENVQRLAEMRKRAAVDPSTELRRAQAWANLPARERRSCAAEVSRITKNYKRGHYAVLGLRRSASQLEIRQGYRQKALLVHPDKNPSPDARLAFEQLREAGETLADDQLRDAYDRKLSRQQEVRVDAVRREVLAFAETGAEYFAARLKDMPRVLYGAAAVSFLLV